MADDFNTWASQNIGWNQAMSMLRGEDPTKGLERQIAAQTLAAQSEEIARNRELQKRLGNMGADLTPDAIAEIMAIDFDAGMKLQALYLEKQKAMQPKLKHKFNPVTGEAVIIDELTGLPIDGMSMDGGNLPDPSIPSEIAGNPKALQTYYEQKAKSAAELEGVGNEKEAKAQGMLNLVDEARSVLPKASSGRIDLIKRGVAREFGASTDSGGADKQLEVIAAALVSNVPRMEGPQSDKDVQMYREAAGEIANPLVPFEERLAALDTIEQLQSKYLRNSNGQAAREPDLSTPSQADVAAELRRRGLLK